MTRRTLLVSVATMAIIPASVLAFCPAGGAGSILCDDFDTYCTPGQYPGGAGVPMGTKCAPSTPKPADGDDNLRAVWEQTSYTASPLEPLCGSAALLDQSVAISPNKYPSTLPYSIRHLARVGGEAEAPVLPISQHTFKDWQTGELNFTRFTRNLHGERFDGVQGEDESPLVLTFDMNSEYGGGMFYNTGYVELGFGSHTDPMNQVNTDYILTTDCYTACNKLVKAYIHPVVCALANPTGFGATTLRHPACPDPDITPPPIRNAIAVGAFPLVDPDPCHCGPSYHGPTSVNLMFFDGQLWWLLSLNSPYPSTGEVTPLDGACMPQVSDSAPGKFILYAWGADTGRAHNTITLTIKKNTAIVKHSAIFVGKPTSACPGDRWIITSETEIPLKYKGPFDSVRTGLGPGCRLANNTSWTSCAAPRSCISNEGTRTRFVDFDNLSLSGGVGWTQAGACCMSPTGACEEDLLEADCTNQGGVFKGSSTSCSEVVCCPTPYADTDGDGDVDAADFGVLQACYTGNQIVTGQCSCFDRNADNKIDQRDVESFILCATGPDIVPGAIPPACMP